MAIQLNAEQKSIRKLFYNTDQYIIPEFQRTYSWGYEECFQLYNDLIEASGNDYFLGNIVIARSSSDNTKPQVIDGQQRLISLWLLLKVLSLYVVDTDLEGTVLMLKSWKKGVEPQMKIVSKVFEQNDNDNLLAVSRMSIDDFKSRYQSVYDIHKKIVKYDKCRNAIEYAALLFFHWLSQEDISNSDRDIFTEFLLDNVSLLPIEMGGETILEARNKALTIFETINNRGKNLQDADIFKARLYSNAASQNKEADFNARWRALKDKKDALNIDFDELFRCYYHIIRGQNGTLTAEGKLRDFFQTDKSSPLTHSSYELVLDDLKKIADILDNVKNYAFPNREIVAWLQVLSAYTNSYPRYAVVAYLFKYEVPDDQHFVRYLKSIARCVYYAGSTTTVKFPIYSIIERMTSRAELDDYFRSSFTVSELSSSSRLLSGLSLIAYYQAGNETLDKPIVEKFVYESELTQCKGSIDLSGVNSDNIYTLANSYVSDRSLRHLTCESRLRTISGRDSMQTFLTPSSMDKQGYVKRMELINKQLVNFFTGNETF